MTRNFSWPNQTQTVKPLLFPKDFVVRFNEGAPNPSVWADLSKPEKSTLPAILLCESLRIKSPSEALLAGLCGLKTRKAVRNAVRGLEERELICIRRDDPKITRVNWNTDESISYMPGSIILWGHWQVLGRVSPSGHALYIALRSLKRENSMVLDSIDIICQVAGISTRHYKAALSALKECQLVSLWEGSSRQLIPREGVQSIYYKNYLESFKVQ